MELGITAPVRQSITRLSDGRALGAAEWGPEDGVPVLFFSGAGMGRALGFGAHLLAGLGARLIAVERPGLGLSDPEPSRTLASWPRDVAELIKAQALPAPKLLAFSQGAPFAFACAAAGIGGAVSIVSGQDELAHPSLAGLLDSELHHFVGAIAADPRGMEQSFATSASAEMMWKLVIDGSSAFDRDLYTSASFAPAYRAALAQGFVQGAHGYARDLVISMGLWPFDVSRITVPVDLWYGGQDASKVHSPDFGASLEKRLPHARRHFVQEAGGSLLWTHAAEILASLLASA